ncbi:Ribosomal protein/NADH dehydrogenase domain protein [Nannochloropsis gaditana]|uniref:Large ribosomal subunit protein mL53 n=1 Tax=Nannochloropsis gaditana TaxID=72520 RepID=W7T2F7_9STRA|nr:Ribosomal protein/NADH dehydrogenase domain protein [Nannochloropsis gaditana]
MGVRPLLRVSKAQATHLFRFITHVEISLNPWSEFRLASTREFWRAISVPRLRKANPKCVINVETHNKKVAPMVAVKYLDGSSQTFEPEKLDVVEIMSDIHQHAHVINAKYEDEGKELEA